MSKQVLLINPVSSAAYLSASFKEFRIFTVALYTIDMDKLSGYAKIKPDLFNKQIYASEDISQIEDLLSAYTFDFILNGLDEGFIIYESICNRLMPQFANMSSTLHYRADKFAMQEALKINNMPYIKQVKIDRNDPNEELINQIGYPCFIKPVNGAASIGAAKCDSYLALKDTVKSCRTSMAGTDFKAFIVQEVITGAEVFVDILSIHGKHYVSSVQTIKRDNTHAAPCYRYQELITDKNLWERAVLFTKQALDICGFKSGFTHTELFHLADGSFRLIEINPRVSGSGGFCNKLAGISGLPTQVDLVHQYLNEQPLGEATVDMLHGYGYLLYLYNFSDKPNRELNLKISDFPSIRQILNLSVAGKVPDQVKDLSNVDCMVLLYNEDKNILNQDMQAIFAIEAQGRLL